MVRYRISCTFFRYEVVCLVIIFWYEIARLVLFSGTKSCLFLDAFSGSKSLLSTRVVHNAVLHQFLYFFSVFQQFFFQYDPLSMVFVYLWYEIVLLILVSFSGTKSYIVAFSISYQKKIQEVRFRTKVKRTPCLANHTGRITAENRVVYHNV